jgi:hypothetical protein
MTDVGPRLGSGDNSDEGGFQESDVVAVGAIDRPAQRDPASVDSNRPLPAEFGPVNRAFPGSLTTAGCFVQRPVDRDDVQVEFDDPVVSGASFGLELVERTCRDPVVATCP